MYEAAGEQFGPLNYRVLNIYRIFQNILCGDDYLLYNPWNHSNYLGYERHDSNSGRHKDRPTGNRHRQYHLPRNNNPSPGKLEVLILSKNAKVSDYLFCIFICSTCTDMLF